MWSHFHDCETLRSGRRIRDKVWVTSQRGFALEVSLSIFFPAYNDAPSLPSLIERTFQVARQHAKDFEVIVVNDGSYDKTGEVLARLAERYAPHMRVITHEQNRGYGGALRSGFAAATKDLVFYTDGDGQYDVRELPKLLALMRTETGLVNGYKLERNDPWHRICIGNVYNAFARLLFRIRLRDIDCDFRLIRRSLLEEIELTSTSGTICVELVRKLEMICNVVETGVHHYPRLHGRSQFFRLRSLAVTFSQLVRLWYRLALAPPLADSIEKARSVVAWPSPE
jgi:glycosyltransferase involved in cell wall biosynthesis